MTRVSLASGRPVAQQPVEVGNGTADIATGLGAVWVTNSTAGTLVKLDPATGRVQRTIQFQGALGGVAVGDDAVWVANPGRGRLIRVTPATGATKAVRIAGRADDADVAAGDGAVFYVDADRGTATRVDPRTVRRSGSVVRVADHPGGRRRGPRQPVGHGHRQGRRRPPSILITTGEAHASHPAHRRPPRRSGHRRERLRQGRVADRHGGG